MAPRVKITGSIIGPSETGAPRRLGKQRNFVGIRGSGVFEKWLGGRVDFMAAAVTGGVDAATVGLKADLREAMKAGGLGEKFPLAIRHDVYPKGQDSLSAAGWVYTKGKRVAEILDAYSKGTVIRAKGGKYLAIPTRYAMALSRTRMGPRQFMEKTGLKLVTIPTRSVRAPFVMVAGLRKRRGKRRGTAQGFAIPTEGASARGDVTSVVMFILVRQVGIKKRIDIDGLAELWGGRVPGYIEQRLNMEG